MKKDKKRNRMPPFIVHWCSNTACENCAKKYGPENHSLFPTHTHGMCDTGKPEFFIDPLAFGKANVNLINDVYWYLMKSSNKNLLPRILDGEIITLKMSDLDDTASFTPSTYEGDKNLALCLRVVYSDFQAIKEAYGEDVPIEVPFVQIWVDGDGFALEDEYYLDGVTW